MKSLYITRFILVTSWLLSINVYTLTAATPDLTAQDSWATYCTSDMVDAVANNSEAIGKAVCATVSSFTEESKPQLVSMVGTIKNKFSEAWFAVEVSTFLTMNYISPVACQKFLTDNQVLIGKMPPMLCTASYRLLNDLLASSNAPQDLKDTLEKLAMYANTYNLIVKQHAESKLSIESTKRKFAHISVILDKLGYNFAQKLLLEILSTNEYVKKFMPNGLNAENITKLLEKHIHTVLLEFCTEEELASFATFIQTNTGKRLMMPSVLDGLKNIVAKHYLDGNFHQSLQSSVESVAAPVITAIQASTAKAA